MTTVHRCPPGPRRFICLNQTPPSTCQRNQKTTKQNPKPAPNHPQTTHRRAMIGHGSAVARPWPGHGYQQSNPKTVGPIIGRTWAPRVHGPRLAMPGSACVCLPLTEHSVCLYEDSVLQAASFKLQGKMQSSSCNLQASICKLQLSICKLQSASECKAFAASFSLQASCKLQPRGLTQLTGDLYNPRQATKGARTTEMIQSTGGSFGGMVKNQG